MVAHKICGILFEHAISAIWIYNKSATHATVAN
jgi:hypothetical protein